METKAIAKVTHKVDLPRAFQIGYTDDEIQEQRFDKSVNVRLMLIYDPNPHIMRLKVGVTHPVCAVKILTKFRKRKVFFFY